MRSLSAILILGLGMMAAGSAAAQDALLNFSTGPELRAAGPFVYARLGINEGAESFSSSGVGGGLRIDTKRLVWAPTNSDGPQIEGLLHPVRLTPVPPAAGPVIAPPFTDYEANIVHNSPSYTPEAPRNLDWRFLTAHGIYAGAVAFDGLITMKGLGRPCGFVEGNSDLGPNPTVKSMTIHSLVEFAAVTTMDYFLKRTRVPGLSYIGAGIGTAKHLHGGIQWLNTGCF